MNRKKRPRCDDASDEDDESDIPIKVIGNHLWYYGSVSRRRWMLFSVELWRVYSDVRQRANAEVVIHLSSDGGDVFTGLSMYDTLRSMSDARIVVICEGTVASAATLMLLGANERRIQKHAFVLIHEISTSMFGKFRECKEDIANTALLTKKMKSIYLDRTKIKEDALDKYLCTEILFTSKQCLKYGIVDTIIRRI